MGVVQKDSSASRGGTRMRAVLAGCCLAGATSAAAVGLGVTSTQERDNVPLVIYSAQGYDKLAAQTFQRLYHIPVELDDNSTGPLLTQIEATLNNPKWGLLWVDGTTAFAELDDQHMLVRGFEPKVRWNSLGKAALAGDESWIPTGVTLMAAVAYNKKTPLHPPASWKQLTEPIWRGKIGMNDPAQSGPTYPFVAGMMAWLGGIKQGEQWFLALKRNGLVINPTNGPTLAALASGQIDVALVQSSAAIGASMTDHSIGVEYLNPVTILPSAIGIDAKAPAAERREAELFAEFVLSPAGQKVMKTGDPEGDSLYYPVVQGVSPNPELPPLAGVKTQTINPYVWGPRENSINSWFEANIVR